MLVTARLQLITLILGNCNHKKETMLCLSVSGKIPIIEITYYDNFSIVLIHRACISGVTSWNYKLTHNTSY